jgi:LPS O-antigen subunit length determinant protein (WzzB/FepE family)
MADVRHTINGLECLWNAIVKILKIIIQFTLLSIFLSFVTSYQQTIQPNVQTRDEVAAGSDGRYVSEKIRALYIQIK